MIKLDAEGVMRAGYTPAIITIFSESNCDDSPSLQIS